MSQKCIQFLTVSEQEGEQRLDKWLKRRFPQLTHGVIEKICRTGQLRIEGKRVKASGRVMPGMSVRVPPFPDVKESPNMFALPFETPLPDQKMIQEAVLFKDEHIIVLNKPPSLPSQGGSGQKNRHVDGLAEALRFGYKDRPKLVHRLDKDTSGVLVLARTDHAARALSESLRHHAARKIYWAVVAGVPQPKQGSIKYALLKMPGQGRGNKNSAKEERMACIHPAKINEYPDAKRARTDFFTLWFLGTRLSWVALEPVTGRTHQLRAHMAEIGHPIIGDGKYGMRTADNMGDGWGAGIGGDISRKLHLHARELSIEHPTARKLMTFVAPLPSHMARTWQALGWHEGDVPADPFEGRRV